MADKKYTLLELNLGDGTVQIGPATLGDGASAVGTDTDTDTDTDEPIDSDGGDGDSGGCGCPARKAGKLLLVLGVLAVVTLVAKKLLGGGEYEELDELEDLSELDEE
jgi:hypothetical protein